MTLTEKVTGGEDSDRRRRGMVGKEVTRGEDGYWRRCVRFTRWFTTVRAGAWKRVTSGLRLSLVARLRLDARSIVDTKVLGLPSVGNGDWVVNLLSVDGESGGTFSKILEGLVSAGFRRSKFF
ncbi:hypothetical protein F2Q70_00012165 [Brassica cretica]|uniref:Uncharacterized protein n=1 Tax=Brassica cretica TaxID=69181 RepID=A0A8S9M571_BRACR|nr:hypothetical protein F2Q68_00005230 [Brassica cretica]KAF2614915.1 hypothetical protein F2Q70_00012165 [Brassica cretica]